MRTIQIKIFRWVDLKWSKKKNFYPILLIPLEIAAPDHEPVNGNYQGNKPINRAFCANDHIIQRDSNYKDGWTNSLFN